MNPYLDQVHQVLPRLLAFYDVNPLSKTQGLGDRMFWAWKTIDFGNAAFQGSANGLSRLIAADALPEGYSRQRLLTMIDQMVMALEGIRSADGSLSEAYPNESSFCVTGLLLYDVMVALETVEPLMDCRERWLAQLEPMVGFLKRASETHGEITNHLAVAAAGLLRYEKFTGDGRARADELMSQIVDLQSPEGWFSEYGGADAGYQTLALSYLADIHTRHPEFNLEEPLKRCLSFLGHYCYPDGSFGGYVGWRGTRFIIPGGIEVLSGLSEEANAVAQFSRNAISNQTVPGLNVFDAPNLPVFFNAWVQAALALKNNADKEIEVRSTSGLPSGNPGFHHFKHAGLITCSDAQSYTIINAKKGGVVQRYEDGKQVHASGGAVMHHPDQGILTSQSISASTRYAIEEADGGYTITINAPMVPIAGRNATPLEFAMLRVLSVTLFRFRSFNELFKKMAVKVLIKGKSKNSLFCERVVRLSSAMTVTDSYDGSGAELLEPVSEEPVSFSAIHMANQGFWQRGDEVE